MTNAGIFAPVFIDLNGDGVQLNPLGTSHASFDFDNDGYREATAWASAQDGILVIDEGADNLVTQAKEIAFSQWTAEDDTDLQALAKTFDSNHDGVLDAKDARFSDFKVWRDANGDGISDAGEMQTLTQAGIKSMNLTVKSGTSASPSDGTQVFGLTDVQRTDGSIVHAVKTTRNAPYLIADCAVFMEAAGTFGLNNSMTMNDSCRRNAA